MEAEQLEAFLETLNNIHNATLIHKRSLRVIKSLAKLAADRLDMIHRIQRENDVLGDMILHHKAMIDELGKQCEHLRDLMPQVCDTCQHQKRHGCKLHEGSYSANDSCDEWEISIAAAVS